MIENEQVNPIEEEAEARAARLIQKLRGVLKNELAEYGGGEAFLRWVRSDHHDTDEPTSAVYPHP